MITIHFDLAPNQVLSWTLLLKRMNSDERKNGWHPQLQELHERTSALHA